jgi:hypothetical protein
MPTKNSDRTGHGQLVREQATATLLELLTRSLEGRATEPATEAHKIMTRPGVMSVWLDEIVRMASVTDITIVDKVAGILEAVQEKLAEHGATLTRQARDALTVSMTATFASPNADHIFDAMAESSIRRLNKAIEQAMTAADPHEDHADLRVRFEKDVRRILGRLRHRKAAPDETIDALVGRTCFFLCQLGGAWEQPILDEFRTLGGDISELLAPYREEETA